MYRDRDKINNLQYAQQKRVRTSETAQSLILQQPVDRINLRGLPEILHGRGQNIKIVKISRETTSIAHVMAHVTAQTLQRTESRKYRHKVRENSLQCPGKVKSLFILCSILSQRTLSLPRNRF